MEFDEIKKELNKFEFEELRNDGEDFFEAVVTRSELTKLTPTLEKIFGSPVAAVNNLPAKERAMIKEFGGIMAGQTLYLSNQLNCVFFAMLWPWSGGGIITLKVGKK
ncbi:MAG: hypothetical protein PHN57_01660 [Candidatus Omnitrophica bacterium]|nr:hypothetical protein [Candidatus Omnitrophota bacterium]